MKRFKLAIYSENNYISDFLNYYNKYDLIAFDHSHINFTCDIYIIDGLTNQTQGLVESIIKVSNNYIIVIDPNEHSLPFEKVRYIKKPFKIELLIDNIDNLVKSNTNSYFINNQYSLEKLTRILTIRSENEIKKITLTEKEALLIQFLLENKSNISKEVLLEDIWNYCKDNDTHTIETHVYRIRQKLGLENKLILTIADGYKLNYE